MAIHNKLAVTQKSMSGTLGIDELAQFVEVWNTLDYGDKKLSELLFLKIEINTPITKPKGIKNAFFDAYVQAVTFN